MHVIMFNHNVIWILYDVRVTKQIIGHINCILENLNLNYVLSILCLMTIILSYTIYMSWIKSD